MTLQSAATTRGVCALQSSSINFISGVGQRIQHVNEYHSEVVEENGMNELVASTLEEQKCASTKFIYHSIHLKEAVLC